MKVACEKTVFIPVTITIESKEELRLFADFFGRSPGTIGDLYGLPDDFMYDKYKELKDILDDRGIPFASKIDVTKK
jgi:hypothetical protein